MSRHAGFERNGPWSSYRTICLISLWTMIGAMSCASPSRIRSADIPIPVQHELPSIDGADVQCLSRSTWNNIVQRDRILRAWSAELEAAVCATQKCPPLRY